MFGGGYAELIYNPHFDIFYPCAQNNRPKVKYDETLQRRPQMGYHLSDLLVFRTALALEVYHLQCLEEEYQNYGKSEKLTLKRPLVT